MSKNKIFIGYDAKEHLTYKVCEYSIRKNSKDNIRYDMYPLVQWKLREKGDYYRDHDALASTEFSLTRFLVPYLSNYEGWSLFMDCDMLITRPIEEILKYCDDSKAVVVVKHDYIPKNAPKMDGQVQTVYPMKNWSSFMLFNNNHPSTKNLTKEYVNSASPSDLHRFSWCQPEEIGAFPVEFNYLVGEYPVIDQLPFNLHYTLGSPELRKDLDDYSDIWYEYLISYVKNDLLFVKS